MSDIKQVIVMRNDLNMRKGKMIAQGAHASIAFLTNKMGMTVFPVKEVNEKNFYDAGLLLTEDQKNWIEGIFTKICVKVQSEAELLIIATEAEESGLTVSLIKDAGLTEFQGTPTYTCCAIGPNQSDEIDKITGHLGLL